MAQGKRKVNLGNGNNVAPTPVENTSASEVLAGLAQEGADTTQESTPPMAEQTYTTENVMPLPDAPIPNGEVEVDEDLVGAGTGVNQRSSIADKRKFYINEIRKLGRAYQGAAVSTLGLAEKLLEGTVIDAFAYAELPNGMKQDDALEMYKLFRMPNKDSKPIDVSSTDFNSNVAKYRNIIFLGMNHKSDAQQWFGEVIDVIEEKTASPDIKKSMKNLRGTFEFLADVVREQLDRDGKGGGSAPLMDEDEIFKSLLKKDKVFNDDAITALVEAYKKLNLARDGKTPSKSGKGGFVGIKDQQLVDIIQTLQDYAFNDLDPGNANRFKAATAKQKRTRRVIKAPTATPGNGADQTVSDDQTLSAEEAEAQQMGDQE